MKYIKNILVLFVLFFIQTSLAGAVVKCINQPITLNWESSNISGCTLTPSTNNSSACSFSPTPNSVGSKPITLTSGSCTNTLACGATSVTDTVTIDTTKVWNGSACVTTSGNLSANKYTCTIPVGQSSCTDVMLTWTTTNPYGTSAITRNNPVGTVFTADNGTNQGVIISGAYASVRYYLYNNANELDQITIIPSCEAGASWKISSGTCEYDATATLSANPIKVSYNGTSTLTWTSSNSTSCTAGGNWSNLTPPTGNSLNGSGGTGVLTEDQTYTLQCFGNGNPSPVMTATVDVCPSGTPLLNSSTCYALPSVTNTLGNCNYTESCDLTITSSGNDNCKLYKDNSVYPNISSPLAVNSNGVTTVNLNQEGTYVTKCTTLSDDGITFLAQAPVSISYSPFPPKPIVSLRASPSNISVNSQTVLTWKVTYPNSVQQNPTRTPCTLTAKPVCPGGNCNASQLLASTTINNIIKNDNTDANDPNGSRRITSAAINEVVPPSSDEWQANGKKTFILNHSMDFMLRCGSGVNESQGARVMVTSSNEG